MAETLWSACKVQVCSHHPPPITFQGISALKAKTRIHIVAQGAMNGLALQHLGASPLSPQPFLSVQCFKHAKLASLSLCWAGLCAPSSPAQPSPPHRTGLPTAYKALSGPQVTSLQYVAAFSGTPTSIVTCAMLIPHSEPHTGVRGHVCALSQS